MCPFMNDKTLRCSGARRQEHTCIPPYCYDSQHVIVLLVHSIKHSVKLIIYMLYVKCVDFIFMQAGFSSVIPCKMPICIPSEHMGDAYSHHVVKASKQQS